MIQNTRAPRLAMPQTSHWTMTLMTMHTLNCGTYQWHTFSHRMKRSSSFLCTSKSSSSAFQGRCGAYLLSTFVRARVCVGATHIAHPHRMRNFCRFACSTYKYIFIYTHFIRKTSISYKYKCLLGSWAVKCSAAHLRKLVHSFRYSVCVSRRWWEWWSKDYSLHAMMYQYVIYVRVCLLFVLYG